MSEKIHNTDNYPVNKSLFEATQYEIKKYIVVESITRFIPLEYGTRYNTQSRTTKSSSYVLDKHNKKHHITTEQHDSSCSYFQKQRWQQCC